MGAGEYVVAKGSDTEPLGHFALAARDYTHSTAPNRRFADLVNQRLVKAMLDNQPLALYRRRTDRHRHALQPAGDTPVKR